MTTPAVIFIVLGLVTQPKIDHTLIRIGITTVTCDLNVEKCLHFIATVPFLDSPIIFFYIDCHSLSNIRYHKTHRLLCGSCDDITRYHTNDSHDRHFDNNR